MKKPNHRAYLKRKVDSFKLIDTCPFDGRETVIFASYSTNTIDSFEDGSHIISKFKGVRYFYDIREMLNQLSISDAFRQCCQLTKYHKNLTLKICKK